MRTTGRASPLLFLFLLAACTSSSNSNKDKGEIRVITEDGTPESVIFKSKDPAMATASKLAREHISTFLDALKTKGEPLQVCVFRAPVTDGETTEHFWFSSVVYQDNKLHGRCDNTPRFVKNIRPGDVRSFRLDRISDWYFIGSDNKVTGGYTVRESLLRMSSAQKAEFRKSFPYEFKPLDQ